MPNRASEQARNDKGKFIDENRDRKPGELGQPEIIRSLISVPLKEERSGKVPVVKPDDDATAIQRKLANYITKNFNGDAGEADLAALRNIYGDDIEPIAFDELDDMTLGADTFDPKRMDRMGFDENGLTEQRRQSVRDEWYFLRMKTGLEPRMYWDDANSAIIYVTDGKRMPCTCNPTGVFTRCALNAKSLNFGQLQAADTIIGEMGDMSEAVRDDVAVGMMGDCRADQRTHWLNDYLGPSPSAVISGASGRWVSQLAEKGEKIPTWNPDASVSEMNAYAKQVREAAERAGVENVASQAARLEHETEMEHVHERYRDAVNRVLDVEENGEYNRSRFKRMSTGSSATVYEEKKQHDEAHLQAAKTTRFAKSFGHIEVDDAVDLNKFQKLGNEFDSYEHMLPPQSNGKADLRFRFTGRHNAIGIYHPKARNIAVDPRTPASFTHEYFHHLDCTGGDGHGGTLSMDPEFRPIIAHYKQTLDQSNMHCDPSRYLAPTEVFARSAELWMQHRVGGDKTSFLKSKQEYDENFDYQPLHDMEPEIFAFFDKHFGQKG